MTAKDTVMNEALGQFDDAYNSASAQTTKYKDDDFVPPGDYQGLITRTTLKASATESNFLVILKFKILAPTSEGAQVTKFLSFRSPEAVQRSKTDLIKLGITTPPSTFPNVIPSLQGKIVRLRIAIDRQDATKNIVWINGVMSVQESEEMIPF